MSPHGQVTPLVHNDVDAQTEVILTNAKIVTETECFLGSLVIRDGIIAEFDSGVSGLSSARDLDGDHLIPGLIDIHTDNLEKHLEPRPGVKWPELAALVAHDRQLVSAGVTTVMDSLCVGDSGTGKQGRTDALAHALKAMERAQGSGVLKADHMIHLRCEVASEGMAEALEGFIEDPAVRMVSVMDHTPGQRQWHDLDKWRLYYSRTFSKDQLDKILEERLGVQENLAGPNREAAIRMAKERNLPLASHDDTTVDHIREAAADGILISEFPTTVAAAEAAHVHGMVNVMGAPNVVKGGSHSGNVAAHELATRGLLDGLASDYVPISMVEAAYILYEEHGLTLPQAISSVTAGPARMSGLNDRGRIEVGLKADLVQVKPYEHMPIIMNVWVGGHRVA